MANSNDDEKQRRIAAARERAALFGDLVYLALQDPVYRNMALSDLEWLILPALETGNFSILNTNRPDGVAVPIAALTWARVSEDVDRRIEENLHRPFRLAAQDYVSGEIYWLAHTFGPPQALEQLIKLVLFPGGKSDDGRETPPGPLAGRRLKQRVRDDRGRPKIVTLGLDETSCSE